MTTRVILRACETSSQEGGPLTSACMRCSSLKSHPFIEAWDIPLFESPNFVAVPSLGALVEGWLLLIPKCHVLSLGSLPDSTHEELNEFKEFLYAALIQCYGSASAFEHGPIIEKSAVGCGVDHAHLHI